MIWYVEDDASIRDIAIYALNSAGFETKGFEDGLSFWDALKKEKPELIVRFRPCSPAWTESNFFPE